MRQFFRLLDDMTAGDRWHVGVMKWTEEDDRPDKLGDYRQVINLTLSPELIPPGIDIFRVAGWTVALIVSETVKLAMEATGCAGAVFEPVT